MGRQLVGGIETGGTKIVARLVDLASGESLDEQRWETSSAERAADDLCAFLSSAIPAGDKLAAIGMAAFGPLIVDPGSPDYGLMQSTTKPDWTGSNLRSELEQRLGVPVAVDTDVSAAAVAEQALGAGEGLPSVAYVTVGTGIGAGLAIRGKSLKGALHPEAGHLPVLRHPDDNRPSVCRFHANCAEGLVSGPAVRRKLAEGQDLADDPLLAELVADYLGQLGAALVMTWSPHRIVWGGGVISGSGLVPKIEQRLKMAIGGYGVGPAIERPGLCAPAALEHAGLEGALLMAKAAAC